MAVDYYRLLSTGRFITYGFLGLFSLLDLIIACAAISWYSSHNVGTPAQGPLGFMIFCGIVSFITMVFLILLSVTSQTTRIFGPLAGMWQARYELIPLSLLFVFWLSGSAAMTDQLGGGLNCGNLQDSPKGIVMTCNSTNAVLAIAWMAFVANIFCMIVTLAGVIMASRAGDQEAWARQLPPMTMRPGARA